MATDKLIGKRMVAAWVLKSFIVYSFMPTNQVVANKHLYTTVTETWQWGITSHWRLNDGTTLGKWYKDLAAERLSGYENPLANIYGDAEKICTRYLTSRGQQLWQEKTVQIIPTGKMYLENLPRWICWMTYSFDIRKSLDCCYKISTHFHLLGCKINYQTTT